MTERKKKWFFHIDSEIRCPTCGQLSSNSRNSIHHPQVCNRFNLDQFALLDSIDDIELIDGILQDENNIMDIETVGDAERELNNTDNVFIEYDLEPGQLIFINSILAANSEEGDTDGLTPGMFIDGEGSENAPFRVLNLDTQ